MCIDLLTTSGYIRPCNELPRLTADTGPGRCLGPNGLKRNPNMASIAFLLTLAISSIVVFGGLFLLIAIGIAEEIEARFQ